MFWSSHILIKLIIVATLVDLVVCFYLLISKFSVLVTARRRLVATLREIGRSRSIGDAPTVLRNHRGVVASAIQDIFAEMSRSGGQASQGLKERIHWDLQLLEALEDE